MTDYFYSWITGRVIQPEEESKLGELLSLFSFFCFRFLFSLLFVEIEIKEEKEYVKVLNKELKVLNKEVNDLSDQITTLQYSLLDKKTNSKIYKATSNEIKLKERLFTSKLESISFKESQIKDISRRILMKLSRLENIQTKKEGTVI